MSKVVEIKVLDSCGLHAKKCMDICKVASHFQSSIKLNHNGYEIDLKSILGLMSLCVPKGDTISLEVCGADQEEACKQLSQIIA